LEERNDIKQIAKSGSDGVQIGIQNIYNGLTPEQATKIAIELFYQNFPKLQEEAQKIANERAEALVKQFIKQLAEEHITDLSCFQDPDIQYELYEAQKQYARFGTQEMLEFLSKLLTKRIKQGEDNTLRISIDKAIEAAGFLSEEQLDTLTLLFLTKDVDLHTITNIETLKSHMDYLAKVFQKADKKHIPYLNLLGCLKININGPDKIYSKKLSIDIEKTKENIPIHIRQLDGDYSASYSGVILAITNAELKTDYIFNPKIWIK